MRRLVGGLLLAGLVPAVVAAAPLVTSRPLVAARPLAASRPVTAPAAPDYPDATNTGVPSGTSLTTVNSNVTLSTPGQVYEEKLVNGCITVTAANVTIRKSKVICAEASAIYNDSTNLLVEDVEIDCGNEVGRTGLTWRNYTARRVNAHGCENIFWAEGDVLIEDSYIHDTVPYNPIDDPHTDGIQIPSDATNITIRHNRIYGGYIDQDNFGNSAITMGANTSNITIDNNILAGGGYTVYCNANGPGTNSSHTNNRFSRVFVDTVGGAGPWTECSDENLSGNVYHETGLPVSPN